MSYLLVLAIRGGNHLGEVLLFHLEHVLEEFKVRLVVVIVGIRLVEIGDKFTTTANAKLCNWNGRADSNNVL
jgi:hypothetical protein